MCISFFLSLSSFSLILSLSPFLHSNYRIVSCKQSIEPYSNVLRLLFFSWTDPRLDFARALFAGCPLSPSDWVDLSSWHQTTAENSKQFQFQFNFNGPQLWQLFRYDSELRTRFEFEQEGEGVGGGIVQIHMRSFRVANYSRANWHNRSRITRSVQRAACERGVQSQVRLRWRSAQLGCLLSELWHRARWGEASEAFNQSNFPIRTNTFGAA